VIGIILVVVFGKAAGKVYKFLGKLVEQYKAHPGDVSNQS
jgi:hypothetical protein